MMTVQSVQCHVAADCTGRTTIQLMWQAQLVLMWQLLEVTCGRVTGRTDDDVDRYRWTNQGVTRVTLASGDTWHGGCTQYMCKKWVFKLYI
jgi:hypothetical protein